VAAVADRAEAAEVLGRRLEPGDVVLVKASRGIELDLLVDAVVDQQAGATLKGPPG
jgi:UDP-N-acetylmuramyl pentapeptide synthase